MTVTKIFQIKELAQEFMHNPKIVEQDENVILGFDYESETGKYYWTGISFLHTIAWRHTKESSLDRYMVSSYNYVSVVNDSEWIKDYSDVENLQLYKHYLVYFDGYGSYEFISQNFSAGVDMDLYLQK
jgi:hypothetical protein